MSAKESGNIIRKIIPMLHIKVSIFAFNIFTNWIMTKGDFFYKQITIRDTRNYHAGSRVMRKITVIHQPATKN